MNTKENRLQLMLNALVNYRNKYHNISLEIAQSAEIVEYTDCTSAEG